MQDAAPGPEIIALTLLVPRYTQATTMLISSQLDEAIEIRLDPDRRGSTTSNGESKIPRMLLECY